MHTLYSGDQMCQILPEEVKEIYAYARPHLVSQRRKSQDGG